MMNYDRINVKRLGLVLSLLVFGLFFCSNQGLAVSQVTLDKTEYGAGQPITIKGQIDPGQDLFLVLCTDTLFKPQDSPGEKEREKLGKKFGDTAIPPIYYLVTTKPEYFATPKGVSMGQVKGLFAFPPFKFTVRVNKLKKWSDIPGDVKKFLGPIDSEAQWKFLVYSHEKKFGINTITKERPIGGGNARMILTDHGIQKEAWNKGVSINLDKNTGSFTVTVTPYKNIAPGTRMAIWVNGVKSASYEVKPAGYFFKTANTYMNPLVVLLGAFIIGVLFVIMGAAGGLFTAAFQITVLGTKGPIGINEPIRLSPPISFSPCVHL